MTFTASLTDVVSKNENRLLGTHPSWERVRVSSIASVQNGFPFPSTEFTKEGGIPLLRIRDVLGSETETFFPGQYDAAYLVDPGQLIIGMDGDFNCALWKGPRALLNQRVCKIVPDERFYDQKLLAHVLPGYLRAINAETSSVTVKHLSSYTIGDIPLPLPPINEQKRLIAEIERQFTRLEAGAGALKRVQANLKRYRATVLKAAVEGRLVPTEAELARREGRSYEPASDLLQRILAERGARWEADQLAKFRASDKEPKDDNWKAKYEEPSASDETSPPPLPEGWAWTQLDQLLSYLRNGISRKPDLEVGIPILRISAVRPLHVDMNDVRFLRGNLEDYAGYVLQQGDLLFTRYNGNPALTGVCGVVRSPQRPTVHPDKLIRAKIVKEMCLPAFLEIALNVGASRDFIASRVRTTAGQAGISGGDLRSTPVPLAPTAEQNRIVTEVERRLSVIDELEMQVEANLKRADRLRQAILKRAFEGKLVPQDPDDEPASVLLERIRTARNSGTATPGCAGTKRTGTHAGATKSSSCGTATPGCAPLKRTRKPLNPGIPRPVK
jgi:type I restriction enzyme, S subunit